MFLFFFFFSLPQAVLDKKYIYRKFKSSHLAKAMFKEQELSVTLTKIPKIGAIMQGKVSSYFFSFPLLFFFPPRMTFYNVFIYTVHFTCAGLRVTRDILSWFHQTVFESSPPPPFSSRFPILPPPLLVWIRSSSCVFGLGKQSCCLGVISRAQISGSFFLGS